MSPDVSSTPSVFLSDPDVTLYHGDVLETLRELPAESVDCVVTSPPYWGLRDYGTGAWEGGDAECDHASRPTGGGAASSTLVGTHDREGFSADGQYRDTCRKCGATRIDQQLGLEPTPEQYVERMVEVFREVRRVLAAHGTCWVNLGDSYAQTEQRHRHDKGPEEWGTRGGEKVGGASTAVSGLKPKDLCGIPWRVAFALQADGWYLRSDIIWAKPNPMPESVTDRPTKAHEYVFLLSKQPRYFFDQEAVREPAIYFGPNGGPDTMDGDANARRGEMKGRAGVARRKPLIPNQTIAGVGTQGIGSQTFGHYAENGRNIRSVWEIATQPYPEAHFATFPEELARRCIAAGCPEQGTVLDPFVGSGTVCFVARKLGRHSIGIDLNAEYLELAARRLQQQSLFAEAAS